MFRKWNSTHPTKPSAPHLQSDEDGQLSEIDTSSMSSESDRDDEDEAVVSNVVGMASGPEVKDPQNNIADLLRREFGPRGTLFSVSSQDYLNERRQKRLVSKKGKEPYLTGEMHVTWIHRSNRLAAPQLGKVPSYVVLPSKQRNSLVCL